MTVLELKNLGLCTAGTNEVLSFQLSLSISRDLLVVSSQYLLKDVRPYWRYISCASARVDFVLSSLATRSEILFAFSTARRLYRLERPFDPLIPSSISETMVNKRLHAVSQWNRA